MQGQRSTLESFPEMFGLDRGSSTSNTGMNPQECWNDLLNPVESGYQECPPPGGETNSTHANAVSRDGMSLSGWNLGEPSLSERTHDQMIHDEAKMELGWSTTQVGSGLRLEERRHEAMITASLGSANINLNSNQVGNGSLFSQPSSSSEIHQNLNLNTGYTSNSGSGTQSIETGIPHMYKPVGSQTEHIHSAGSSADPFGTASGSAGYLTDEADGRHGCSLDGRRLSCKRKTLEGGVSGQSSLGGSPSCFLQAENRPWHSFPARYDAASSSSMSTPTENPLALNLPEPLNPQSGVGMRGVASDSLPALASDSHPALTHAAESSQRNFRMRTNPANQQDLPPSSLTPTGYPGMHSRVWSPHHLSSRVIPFSQALDLRPAAASSSSQSRSHITHNNGLRRNVHPFPYNGAPNSRVGGSSSTTVIPVERANTLREEIHSRRMARSISEHPMFLPTSEMRNLAQDPTNWSLANGSSSTPGNFTSNSRVGSSSVVHPSPTSTWLPHPNPTSQYTRRLSEVVRRSLYASAGSESGAQISNLPSPHSNPSSSQEVLLSSATGQPGNHQPYPRSAFWMDRQGDGVSLSFRSLASAGEGRSRLLSEIRNVLDIVRRGGEGLRFEDVLILDQSVFFGAANLHDRHRDMRLDVDNMSYEELLALEERIGNVSTGLSEDIISKCLKQRKYYTIRIRTPSEIEPCCICQEEYVEGEDLGKLDCGHDFHSECIKQWLKQKNLCPVCKTTALVT